MIKTPLNTVIGGAFWTPGATIIGSSSKTLTQLIKSIFGVGEQGFAYDPNDLTTLYQDAAGTVPVTAAGQPVGLVLDKSNGLVLSSELLINNSFNTDTNWIKGAGWTITGGEAVFDGTTTFSALTQNIVLDGNALYKIEIDITSGATSTPDIRLLLNDKLILTPSAKNGKSIAYIQSLNNEPITSLTIQSRGTTGDAAKRNISSVSLKKLSGNHAYQTVSAMRPLLVAAPQRLDYDAVDDNLITKLPAQLTGCTVIRAVPNVGTQILTNQTIPTPYNDNIDNCGLIVINRALTASETSQITKLFNKAAGV